MAAAKETAEEQLLRMIEGPGRPSPGRGPVKGFSLSQASEQLRQRVRIFWQWAFTPQRQETDVLLWRLRLGERVLWLLLLGLGLYLVVDLFIVPLRPRRLGALSSHSEKAASGNEATEAVEPRLKAVDEYRQAIAGHNPFALASRRGEQAEDADKAAADLAQQVSTLTVVGINRGRVPEVLVEDTEARRTYFLKIGDQVKGLTVKAIDQSGVLVTDGKHDVVLK